MPQFSRPASTTTIGNFTDQGGGTTNIHTTIDEDFASPNDADYIRSPTSPVSEVYVSKLANLVDPLSSSSHTLKMRTSTDQDAQETLDFTQQLRLGYTNEGAQGTLIASHQRTGVSSTTWTNSTYTLSGAEADAITDYTSLYSRIIVNKP